MFVIYKGKNFDLNFKNKIKAVKPNKINISEIRKYYTLTCCIDQRCSNINETVLFLNKSLTFNSLLIQQSINQKRNIYFFYIIINNYKLYPKLIKIETRDKSIYDIVQTIANEMTTIIKKYPEQYLWSYKRFNVTY